jgi:peptidoglycan/LPS O-acetylase OafA/YrhL
MTDALPHASHDVRGHSGPACADASNRNITGFLKGIAISSVLINHYTDINNYLAVHQPSYANGIIALFFVLSGYGIFYSLNRFDSFNPGNLTAFYIRRAVRVFPIYWLSLLLFSYSRELRPFSADINTVRTYLAIPLFQAPSLFWFVTSLVQCYLLAPALYSALKKFGTGKYIISVLSLMLLSSVCYSLSSMPYKLDHFVYRFLFLGHIFLFSLGLALPLVMKKPWLESFGNRAGLPMFIAFFAAVYLTRQQSKFFLNSGVIAGPILVIAAVLFCFSVLKINTPRPLMNLFSVLGAYSYSIYLFHIYYYETLFRMNFINTDNVKSIILTLVFLPVFLLFCMALEKAAGRLCAPLIS